MRKDSFIRADLHLHSIASDGALTPRELVQRVANAGLRHMALTDHETMGGLMEAETTAKQAGINFIPGVEINTAGRDHVHVLLYFVDNSMTELTTLLDNMRRERDARCGKIIAKLNELGIHITLDDLDLPEGTVCGRPHIANALMKRGYVSTTQEAFDRFLDVDQPAYVPRTRYETADIIRLARSIGAVPILAHPGLIRNKELVTEAAIQNLIEAGLMGIEAYHAMHDDETCAYWDQLTRRLGLIVTGGSDYHKDGDNHGAIGGEIPRWQRMDADVMDLVAIRKGREN